jgi:hypothetical protein
MAIAFFHISNSLGAHSSDFLLLHFYLLPLHLFKHLLVSRLFCLTLLPLLKTNLGNDSIVFLFLLLFVFKESLFVFLDLFLNHVLTQFNETDFQPLFEDLIRLLFLHLLRQSLLLLDSELMLTL